MQKTCPEQKKEIYGFGRHVCREKNLIHILKKHFFTSNFFGFLGEVI